MHAKKSVSMKAVVLLLAVVLLIGCVAGGTLAYLMTKSETVTNTFVAGAIGDLTLTENTGDSYIVIPGVDITKAPVVTFNGNNVDAYVFVKVEGSDWTESNGTFSLGTDQEMTWTIAEGWTKLENIAGVYYREVAVDTDIENTAKTEMYGIIKDNKITVSSEITKNNIGDYTKSLTFAAYAIQQDAFADAAAAWNVAKDAQ